MRRARLVSLAVALTAGPGPLAAQWKATADVGVARLNQSGIPESNATTFGAGAESFGERAWFRTSLLAAHAANDRWTGQGVALASLLGPLARGLRWELSGIASAFDETNGPTTASGEVMARARSSRFALGAGGGWVVAGGHGALLHLQGDAWRIVGDNQFIGTISFVDAPVPTTPSLAGPTARTRYADISATWRREARGLSLGAGGGVRTGAGSLWGSADAALWFAPRTALVASVGRSLEDVTRGVPSTRYASVSIRISAGRHATIGSGRERGRGPRVVARRNGLEIRADGASMVEVMGDFTGWVPAALARDGKRWRLERALRPGLHRITLRIDGGEWGPPPNLPRTTDDLGGVVGLMTVP